MISRQSLYSILVLALAMMASNTDAFAPIAQSMISQHQTAAFSSRPPLAASFVEPTSSSFELSAVTLDPTTVLSDLLSGLITTPAILLVPIVAALGVASLIAFLIVSYANPEVEDDEI